METRAGSYSQYEVANRKGTHLSVFVHDFVEGGK